MRDLIKQVGKAAVEKNMPWTLGSKKSVTRLEGGEAGQMQPKKKTKLGGEVK